MNTNRTLSFFARLAILTAGIFVVPQITARDAVTNGFTAAANREFVEVNLDRALIVLASEIVAASEPDVAALLAEVDRISVRVIGLDDSNRDTSLARIENIRTQLASEGWSAIVTVREGLGGDNVSVLARVSENAIEGVVITVIDSDDEVVVLDIAGRVRTEDLVHLVERLEIDELEGISDLLKQA